MAKSPRDSRLVETMAMSGTWPAPCWRGAGHPATPPPDVHAGPRHRNLKALCQRCHLLLSFALDVHWLARHTATTSGRALVEDA